MIVTWYSAHDAEKITTGIFHYEQAIALQGYCDTALYYPFDAELKMPFMIAEEKGLLTFRSRRNNSKLLKYLQYIADFRKILREYKPDVIHAHVGAEAGKLAILLGKLYRIPVVITEHSPIEMMHLEIRKRFKGQEFAYYNSKANICVSDDLQSRLSEYFPKGQFQIIYNGVNINELSDRDGEKYRIEEAINCCIVAGFYSKDIKGYQYLLPAIKKLVDDDVNIVLHICGAGTYYQYYVDLAKEMGIEHNCIFYGHCNKTKLYSIMAQMDFAISSSLYESAGVSVEEAMLLGKPLVVTKSGGASSLVTEKTAIVVEVGSTEALFNGIKEMVSTRESFDSDIIRSYAIENFGMDNVCKKYMQIYQSIIGKYNEK